jgi:hypothetical protein
MVVQASDIDEGILAGTRRAHAVINPSLESPGDALRSQILELFENWQSDLSSRFVALYSEMVTIATFARIHYQDLPLTDEDLRSFLEHSERFLNSFKHK